MKKILLLITILAPLLSFGQKFSDDQIKAAYIYNFLINIEWPNEKELSNFKIGVYGEDTSIVQHLSSLEKEKKVRNLPIKIIVDNNLDNLLSQNPQAVFVTEDMSQNLKLIYYTILGEPILMITDNSEHILYVMLNFMNTSNNKISFELYKKNIEEQGLTILPKLLVLGGTELQVREMYKLKEQELEKERLIVKEQQEKLAEQEKQIQLQLISIQEQNKIIEIRKKSIDSLREEISGQQTILAVQNENLEKLQEEIILQQTILKQKLFLMEAQKDSIKYQKAEIQEQKDLMAENYNKLDELNIEIEQREKDIEKQKGELSNLQGTVESQQLYMWLMGLVILLVIFIGFIIWRNFKQKKKLSEALSEKNTKIELQSEELKSINHELVAQKEELIEQKEFIEHQNEYITDSIRYATRIQFALLPSIENMSKRFESFLIFRPKDIVSGDFYWFYSVKVQNKQMCFFAVVDCTGHGVPGALMSMLGSRILSETVAEKKIYSTGEILADLNRGLINLLYKEGERMNDGMDAVLCKLEIEDGKKKLDFSGAKRPLIIYHNQEKKTTRVKGSRRAVGGYFARLDEKYEINQVDIKTNDVIYLSTDGYIDQNNPHRKRIGTAKFVELVDNNGHKSIKEQHKIFENELEKWQGGEPQRDDIALLAIKI